MKRERSILVDRQTASKHARPSDDGYFTSLSDARTTGGRVANALSNERKCALRDVCGLRAPSNARNCCVRGALKAASYYVRRTSANEQLVGMTNKYTGNRCRWEKRERACCADCYDR